MTGDMQYSGVSLTWPCTLRRDDLGGRSAGNKSGNELALATADDSDL